MIKQAQDEIDYKVKFAQNYFNLKLCKCDIERIDLILPCKNDDPLLYIEARA